MLQNGLYSYLGYGGVGSGVGVGVGVGTSAFTFASSASFAFSYASAAFFSASFKALSRPVVSPPISTVIPFILFANISSPL